MATEPERSEIMSGAPSSSEFASQMPPQSGFSADAALILAALGRMEAVVRDERAAFDRLRVMLGEMAQAIAKAKAVADSETAANLLDELEHRIDAMIEIAGRGPVAAAAAIPDPQAPSTAARIEHDAALLAHGTSEAQHADAAPDAGAVEEAIQHPAEPDLVPTVSEVVSRLSADELTPLRATDIAPAADAIVSAPTVAMLTAMVEALRDSISAAATEPETEFVTALEAAAPQGAQEAEAAQEVEAVEAAEAVAPPLEVTPQLETSSIEMHTVEVAEAADIPPPPDATLDNGPILAMLSARLEALNASAAASAPEPEAPIEAPATESVAPPLEVAPQDLAPQDLAPPPETSPIESAEAATPAMEIVEAEAAQAIEASQAAEAPQAVEAPPAIDVAETAQPPADAAPDQGSVVAMLSARLAALRAAAAAAALEPQALIEAPPRPETSSIEIAEVAPPAAETVQAAEAVQEIEAPQAVTADPAAAAIHPEEDAASAPRPRVSDVHESALLASLEQMGARPFPPPDEGTAVIFASKPESEFLPEFTRELIASSELASSELASSELASSELASSELARSEAAIKQEQPAAPPSAAEPAALAPSAGEPAPAEPPAMPIEPAAEPAATAALPDAAVVAETAASDFDPADFLFEPEPEPDPAAFLLDPAPPPALRAKTPVLPQPEFVAPPAQNPEAAQPVEPDPPAQPKPAPHDPLHALKAMSENEKIALFS